MIKTILRKTQEGKVVGNTLCFYTSEALTVFSFGLFWHVSILSKYVEIILYYFQHIFPRVLADMHTEGVGGGGGATYSVFLNFILQEISVEVVNGIFSKKVSVLNL